MEYGFGEKDEPLKHQFGSELPDFKSYSESKYTVIFAMDYLSLSKSKFCFNNPKVKTKDYHFIFELFKEISELTFSDLYFEYSRDYHFHQIHFHEKPFLKDLYRKLVNAGNNDKVAFPTLYQIEVYTSIESSPRIVGYFGIKGVFHILWLDYSHEIYPDKRTKRN